MAKNRLTSPCKAVVIGGSAGSIDVLMKLLPALRPDLSFSLLIVLHRRHSGESSLANLLSVKTVMPVREVEDKDPILPGQVYLAPADYHLLIEKNQYFSLDFSEKVNFSRPSLDVTFESAADAWGPEMVGILLSGANADGSDGLRAVKKAGGVIIAQKPETAQSAFMPQQAILSTPIDHVFDVVEIAEYINSINR
ncbi:chemotaxis protein CheB [Larkinella soli]|uniref:chemotaxis protein CheB n=1 Tax=Larkinella soli TaxID=1770527 RepID=UPI000FFB49C6|nr:chemotaxis protein CheB [Larkinella soli]